MSSLFDFLRTKRRELEQQRLIERVKRDALTEAMAVFEAWQSARDFETNHTNLETGDRAREAYDTTPLMNSAIGTVSDLVLGDGVTYGELDDPKAYEALEDWYNLNKVAELSKEMLRDWLLDGVLLPVIADDAPKNQPAWVNLWDVIDHPVELQTEKGNPRHVIGVKLPREKRPTVKPEFFALRQNKPARRSWDKNRLGVSPMATAINASFAHARLLETRLTLHEIRARINGVYYAFADSQEELQAAAARFKNLPRSGHLTTLWRDRNTGQSEALEILTSKVEGADAEKDIRAYIRTVAAVAGLPEHFLAVGDTGNRATAESMSEPMVRRMEALQELIIGLLTELFRKELVRRFGPNQTYSMVEYEVDGLKRTQRVVRVTADELTIPLGVPAVRNTEADTDRVILALDKKLISKQTATRELGYDPALEAELMSNEEGEDSDADKGEPDEDQPKEPEEGESDEDSGDDSDE